jgi:hypothetical protein
VSLPRPVRAAAGILEFLETKGRPACVIGGIVVSRWGEPRATTDVDLAVLAELGDEQNVLAELLSTYPSREPNPEAFASANRIALLHLPGRIHADISLAAFPFEREVLERSTDWSLSKDLSIRTCSAEDLVIYKSPAGLATSRTSSASSDASGAASTRARIRHWGREFADLKEDPDLLRPFEDALKKAGLPD